MPNVPDDRHYNADCKSYKELMVVSVDPNIGFSNIIRRNAKREFLLEATHCKMPWLEPFLPSRGALLSLPQLD